MDDDPYQQALNQTVHSAKDVLLTADFILTLSVLLIFFTIYVLLSGSQTTLISQLSWGESSKEHTNTKKKKRMGIEMPVIPRKLFASITSGSLLVSSCLVIISAHAVTYLGTPGPVRTLSGIALLSLLLIFAGKILSRIFAVKYSFNFAASAAAMPFIFLEKVFRPANLVVINSSLLFGKGLLSKNRDVSLGELTEALERNEGQTMDEKKILQGLANFGTIEVREIMTSRVDVAGINIKTRFKALISQVVESGYSRIPVFKPDLDNITGIL